MASEKRARRVMPEEGVQLVRRQGVEGAGEPGRARFACPRARHATADQHHSHKAASPTETSSLWEFPADWPSGAPGSALSTHIASCRVKASVFFTRGRLPA